MKINPIWETTLAKDIPPGPQGQPAHKAGAVVALLNEVVTNRLGEFLLTTPNPVCFYLDLAEKHIRRREEFIQELNLSKKMVRLKKDFRRFDENSLYEMFETAIVVPIFLYTALEAFSNQLIPTNYTYLSNKGVLNKTDIEKSFSLDNKFKKIIDKEENKKLCKTGMWPLLLEIKKLRDELVHLKTRGQEKTEAYNHIYSKLIDSDFEKWQQACIDIIKYYKSDYFN